MIYAVDTSVLLDVFVEDPLWASGSRQLFESLAPLAEFIICPEVYAELAPNAVSTQALDDLLEGFPLAVRPTDVPVARRAGQLWKSYRRAGGSRSRIVTDFIVAAHALVHADALITRDDGFFRRYFTDLKIVAPAQPDCQPDDTTPDA